MLSEFGGYLPYQFYGYGILFKIIKGIWDTGTPFQGLFCIRRVNTLHIVMPNPFVY